LAGRSPCQADYHWAVLQRLLSWGLDGGLVDCNPCTRGGRVYHGTRADKIWTFEDEEKFMTAATPEMRLAFMMRVWTGQRQGDLLQLLWTAFNGTHIRLRQNKGGRRVVIPVGGPLKRLLATTPKRNLTILTDRKGGHGGRGPSSTPSASPGPRRESPVSPSTTFGVRR
jgi:integrase